MRRDRTSLTSQWWLLISYILFAASGLLALTGPSPVLLKQGGHVIAVVWGIFCLTGAALGVTGLLRRNTVIELVGDTLGASATLTWAAALIMQAHDERSIGSLTAACLAGVLVAHIGQRWSDARRQRRPDRKE
jgi:hypothetical protein